MTGERPVVPAVLPAAAAAATAVLVGAAIVATRIVVDQVGPASLALLRYLVGVACLLPVVAVSGPPRIARRDLLPIALLGIVQFGVLIALMNYGLRVIPAARAALIFATTPLLTLLLAAGFGHEPLTAWKTSGVLLAFLGVGVTVAEGGIGRGGGAGAWLGDLAVLASALCGAACSVLYRPYLRRYPALPLGAVAMLASVGFLAVLAAWEGFFLAPPRLTAAGWAAVAFIGASSGLGYYLWLWALGHATPTRVTVALGLSPIAATLLGRAVLGEPVSGAALLGLAGVTLGLIVAHHAA